jgi:hypothetical protein
MFTNGHLVANGCLVRAIEQDVHFYLATKTKRWQDNLFHLCNMHITVQHEHVVVIFKKKGAKKSTIMGLKCLIHQPHDDGHGM